MRKLKFKVDPITLETIHIAFIWPILEYADVISDNCSFHKKNKKKKKKLEKIQTETARVAIGTTNLVLLNNLYEDISGCSSLNLDLFLKSITDSSLCHCGSLENGHNYLIHCRLYQDPRVILLNSFKCISHRHLICYCRETHRYLQRQTIWYLNMFMFLFETNRF